MNKDITVLPYEYIVTFTKTDNIAIRFENGDYICEIQEEHQDLVRCKECRHSFINENHPQKPRICGLTKMCGTTKDDWFCADGEREGE